MHIERAKACKKGLRLPAFIYIIITDNILEKKNTGVSLNIVFFSLFCDLSFASTGLLLVVQKNCHPIRVFTQISWENELLTLMQRLGCSQLKKKQIFNEHTVVQLIDLKLNCLNKNRLPHTRFKYTKLPFTRICKLLIRPTLYVKFVLIRVASNWCSVQLPYLSLFVPNRLPGFRNECDGPMKLNAPPLAYPRFNTHKKTNDILTILDNTHTRYANHSNYCSIRRTPLFSFST